jgi:hypothetical protein
VRLKVGMHILMCVHCRRYVAQIRAIGAGLRRLLAAEPAPERCARLEREIMAHVDG